jgi:plasmid maintenance system antidote protein VapI
MALDSSDMADLTEAISKGIRRGFDDYFSSGRGAGRGRRGGIDESPPPPRTRLAGAGDGGGGPEGPSPLTDALSIPESQVDAQANVIMNKVIGIGAQMINVNKAAFDNAANLQNNEMSRMNRGLVQTFGAGLKDIEDMSTEVDFSSITNEFAKSQLQIFASLRDDFNAGGDMLDITSGNLADLVDEFQDFSSALSNQNIQAVKKISGDNMKDVIKFSKATGVSAEGVADLINVQFAQTGKVSTEILDDLVSHAEMVGREVGATMQDLLDDTTKLVKNMDFFTNIGVAGATRLAASLKEVGMQTSTFQNVVGGFRDFGSAVEKANLLSSLFDIQIDAQEYMYLANEDEEAFARRLREDLLSQGEDFEKMSNTKQRALAQSLSIPMSELKTLMNANNTLTSQADMLKASGEAATQTQEDREKTLDQTTLKYQKSAARLAQIAEDQRFLAIASQINKHSEAMAGYSGEVIKSLGNQSAFGKVLNEATKGSFKTYTAGVERSIQTELSTVAKGIEAGEKMLGSLEKSINSVTGGTEKAINKLFEFIQDLFFPSSMPKIYRPIEEGTKYLVGYMQETAPFISDPYKEGYEDLYDATSESWSPSSLPKVFKSVGEGSEFLKSYLAEQNLEIDSLTRAQEGALVDLMGLAPEEINTVLSADVNLNEEISALEELSKSLAADNVEDFSMPEAIEEIKVAIISAIQTGMENIDQTTNVTLQIDKKKLAEVLLEPSTRTSDNRSFAFVQTS